LVLRHEKALLGRCVMFAFEATPERCLENKCPSEGPPATSRRAVTARGVRVPERTDALELEAAVP